MNVYTFAAIQQWYQT